MPDDRQLRTLILWMVEVERPPGRPVRRWIDDVLMWHSDDDRGHRQLEKIRGYAQRSLLATGLTEVEDVTVRYRSAPAINSTARQPSSRETVIASDNKSFRSAKSTDRRVRRSSRPHSRSMSMSWRSGGLHTMYSNANAKSKTPKPSS